LRGIVLRIEQASQDNLFGDYSGLDDSVKEPLVKIKVRIPELHPYPEPDIYGPEGDDGTISLYPTFVAINANIPTPAVGEIVYVDYGDRANLEDPKYFGPIFNKPVFGGVNIIKTASRLTSLFDGIANSLSDSLSPPTNGDNPIPMEADTVSEPKSDIVNRVRNFWQGGPSHETPWTPNLIGNSRVTFGAAGCLLTCLTISSNTLLGTNLNPGQVNVIATRAGAIDSGGNTIVVTAASALKLNAPLDKKVVGGTLEQIRKVVDTTLEAGGLVMLHVDLTGDISGDHFILIHSRQKDTYIASDPALGASITLSNNLTADTRWGNSLKHYRPISAVPVFKNT